MRHARRYPNVIRRWYRPREHECLECHRTLREAVAVSRRTVIPLEGVIKLNHAGYRCPDPQYVGHTRTYRSVEADALALPHFTYGLDIVLLVGRLRLREHQPVDEIHQELLTRLEPLGGDDRTQRNPVPVRSVLYTGASEPRSERRPGVAGPGEEERRHHRVSGRDPAGEGQRDGVPGPRCTHGARPGCRERDGGRRSGDESAAFAGGGLGGGEEGEGAGDDHRCAGERAQGGGGALAAGAAPSLPVPRAARRLAGRLRGR